MSCSVSRYLNKMLPSLNIRLQHFYSNDGAELVAAEVLGSLHNKSGVTTSHAPRNIPQMNSVTEW